MAAKPTKIPIMGIPFRVSYGKLPKDRYGETDGPVRLFKIDAKLKDEQLKATLIHEILHGILYVSGIAEILEKYDGDQEGKLEEAVVIALEHGLTPIISLDIPE